MDPNELIISDVLPVMVKNIFIKNGIQIQNGFFKRIVTPTLRNGRQLLIYVPFTFRVKFVWVFKNQGRKSKNNSVKNDFKVAVNR